MGMTDDALTALIAARDRTVAAGTARIGFRIAVTAQWPKRPRRRRGGLVQAVFSPAKRLLKRKWIKYWERESQGVVDFTARRYVFDHNPTA